MLDITDYPIIDYEDIRVGDQVALDLPEYNSEEFRVFVMRRSSQVLPGARYRLIHREKPKLPTEPGIYTVAKSPETVTTYRIYRLSALSKEWTYNGSTRAPETAFGDYSSVQEMLEDRVSSGKLTLTRLVMEEN